MLEFWLKNRYRLHFVSWNIFTYLVCLIGIRCIKISFDKTINAVIVYVVVVYVYAYILTGIQGGSK